MADNAGDKVDQTGGDTPRLRGMIQMWRGYNFEPLKAVGNTRLGV